MKCYFNDIFGCTGYLLMIGFLLTFTKTIKIELIHVIIFTLFFGLIWEFITPLYRHDTTSDVLDLFAYMTGGLLFWYVFGGKKLRLYQK